MTNCLKRWAGEWFPSISLLSINPFVSLSSISFAQTTPFPPPSTPFWGVYFLFFFQESIQIVGGSVVGRLSNEFCLPASLLTLTCVRYSCSVYSHLLIPSSYFSRLLDCHNQAQLVHLAWCCLQIWPIFIEFLNSSLCKLDSFRRNCWGSRRLC